MIVTTDTVRAFTLWRDHVALPTVIESAVGGRVDAGVVAREE